MQSAVWLAWVGVVGLTTWRTWQWHLNYFKSPGAEYYRIAVILIPALAPIAWAYCRLRRRLLVRYEPLAFASLVGSACVFYEPRATAVALALFLSSCAAGRFALRIAGLQPDGPLERITIGFGTGVGTLITVASAAGLAKLLTPQVFVILLLSPLILLWRDVREVFADFRGLELSWAHSASARHPLAGIGIVFAAIAVVCALMITLAPSVAFDSVAMHLPSVEYYAAGHALRPVPGIEYSYYPQGFEMLWTLGYALAGQAGAQMISATFFPLMMLVLIRLARECGLDKGTSALAAIFTATMPFIHWTGSVMKNDLPLAFFEALALLAFLRWLDGRDFRWIALGTFFLAQAFGIKLVALFGFVPLGILYSYAVWRQPRRWRAAMLVSLVLLLFGGWWMARDYALTGNAFAPSRLGAVVRQYADARPRPFAERVLRDVEAAWRITFDGQGYFESPLPNPAGILLFALAPLALLSGQVRPRTRAQLACALFTGIYLIYWVLIVEKIRYAILPCSLVAMWLAARARGFYDGQSSIVRVSLIALVTYCLLIATMGLMIVGINGPQLAYFSGRLDKAGYLRAAMHAYAPVEFLRKKGIGHARVFGVDNLARAYSADPSNFDGVLCPAENPCDPAKVAAAVRSWSAEYLILPESGAVSAQTLEDLGRPTRIYSDTYYSIYRLSGYAASPME